MRTGVMCPKGIICQLCNRNRNSGMWRVYLQNSRDVGSTAPARAARCENGSGLISSAGAANVADGFLNNSSCFPQYFHG